MMNLEYDIVFSDVDPPRDLTAVNVQTDSATLTWKHPHAAVSGYTLTFSSADGIIRVRATSNLHELSITDVTHTVFEPIENGNYQLFLWNAFKKTQISDI